MRGWQVGEKENFHWQPLNLKLFLKPLSAGKKGEIEHFCLKKFRRNVLWMVGSVPREVSGICGGTCSRGQQSRGVQGVEQGLGVPRKELGNKEGKQKPRALTVPWTGAGKSSIIPWKTGLPKEPLFESWQDLCPCFLWKSFPNYLRSQGWDLIPVNPSGAKGEKIPQLAAPGPQPLHKNLHSCGEFGKVFLLQSSGSY